MVNLHVPKMMMDRLPDDIKNNNIRVMIVGITGIVISDQIPIILKAISLFQVTY